MLCVADDVDVSVDVEVVVVDKAGENVPNAMVEVLLVVPELVVLLVRPVLDVVVDVVELVVVAGSVLNSVLDKGTFDVSGEYRKTVSVPTIKDVICNEKSNVPLEEVSLG